MRSNIAFVVPILWRVLPKEVKIQVVRRVDQVLARGHAVCTEQAFAFVNVVSGGPYLSATARKYKVEPLITKLEANLDTWAIENEVVRELAPYAAVIPPALLPRYVAAIVRTYVGYMGGSANYPRTDFYANGAALVIPKLVEAFDDRAAQAFVATIRTDKLLQGRLERPAKLKRLRSLGNVVLGRVSDTFGDKAFLKKLANEKDEAAFWTLLGKKKE